MSPSASDISPDINIDDLAARIDAAKIYELVKRTPCEPAAKLSAELGRDIWFKREDLQDVFSFKIRGATNRIAHMSKDELAKGVCAASAGNHAQGMAAAAKFYGAQALIFMPVTTPNIKVEAVHSLGGKTRLVGDNYDAACAAAMDYAKKSGAIFVHPFDEIDVIAGQGTVAKEIFEQMNHPPTAIYVCVGGGGLISGIGAFSKSRRPDTQIICCEPAGAPTLETALKAGKPVTLNQVDGFADGVAVKRIGTTTFAISQHVVDRCINVTNDEISAAIKDIFEATRTVVEPGGAVALAALIKDIKNGTAPDKEAGPLVVTISGANVNFDRIGHIVERAELGAGGEMLFSANIPEEKGSFIKFCKALGARAVTEFNYRYADQAEAHVLVGVKLNSIEGRERLIADLAQDGVTVTDLSHDSLSKRHLRHMVGGRSNKDCAELIYRFDFPERPGALSDFLTALDGGWNISLFHYRNHGSSQAHVLCGFQVPNGDVAALEAALDKTQFPRSPETDNVAYQYFLKG